MYFGKDYWQIQKVVGTRSTKQVSQRIADILYKKNQKVLTDDIKMALRGLQMHGHIPKELSDQIDIPIDSELEKFL